MKTLEEIKELYITQTIDGRDTNRLAMFASFEMFPFMGTELNDDVTKEMWDLKKLEYTRENIMNQLKMDVAFGFEKALNKRGISSNLMANVVNMWNWILEEGLEGFTQYAHYGLPLFKATALKYGFDNPIGDDTGSEDKYTSDSKEG